MKQRKDRIYAFLKKPNGRGSARCWNAFSFTPKATQSDVQSFMCSIHVSSNDYFLTMESSLEKVSPFKGSSNARTIFFINSEKYGRLFVNDTQVFSGYTGKRNELNNRLFKLD